MSRDDLKMVEASISTLVTENASALAKLRTLKRRRRALSAGYASGDKRRASVRERDEKIRGAYHNASERYGIIGDLAKQHKLTARQVHRILGPAAVRQSDRDAPGAIRPSANAARLSEVPATKPPGIQTSPQSSSDPPALPNLPSRRTRVPKLKKHDDLEGHQGDLLFSPTGSTSRGKP